MQMHTVQRLDST